MSEYKARSLKIFRIAHETFQIKLYMKFCILTRLRAVSLAVTLAVLIFRTDFQAKESLQLNWKQHRFDTLNKQENLRWCGIQMVFLKKINKILPNIESTQSRKIFNETIFPAQPKEYNV